jgi:PAS domain S-box-containing protein
VEDPIDVLSAEDRFRVMADATPVMIWATDPSGRIAFVNAAWERFFGRTAEEVRATGWQPMVHPDDVDAYAGSFFHALNTRSFFDAQCRALRADGEWRWVHSYAAAYFCPSGEFLGMVGSSPDITEQVEAGWSLRESEARFRKMADHAPVTIWMCDARGHCTFVSRGWQEHTGQAPDAALGNGWLDRVHPDDREHVRSDFEDAARQHAPYRCEYRLQSPSGAYRAVLAAAAPMVEDGGEFRGYIGSILDITERKAQEDALRQADERKDLFLAVLSHELRNPLGAIANATEVLRCRAVAPEISAATNIIKRQVGHLKHLVDDLLDVARLATGKINLRRQQLDVRDAVAAALEAAQRHIAARGHDIAVIQPAEAVYVDADPTRLSQLIVNLLTNSAKYTRPGGRIELRVTAHAAHVELQVIDNGAGIGADMLPRVFDMFWQEQPLTSHPEGGLGIGLAIAKSIVDMHGGVIEAQSAGAGKGSTFTVRLPRMSSSPVRQTPAPPASSAQQARMVLVVDDNEDSAKSLAMMLRMMGHETYEAYSGEAALALARAVHPQIIVLDIGMPDMSGYEVAERLRAEPHGDGVLLIALTGFGQEEDKQRSTGAGFDFHLTKPVDPDELKRVLALEHARARAGGTAA